MSENNVNNDNSSFGAQVPPAGWYPDPHASSDADGNIVQRYWNGAQWTEHVAAPVAAAADAAAGVAGSRSPRVARGGAAGARRDAASGVAAAGAAGAAALPVHRGFSRLKWWQWALIVLGVIVLISIIVNGARAERDDTAAGTPTTISKAEEVAAPEPKPIDDREKVPGLVGLTVAEARAAVEAAGFVLTSPDGTGDDWVVLTQTISKGQQADAGTTVVITAEAPKPVYTLAQQNAISKAKSYLAYSGFSRTGLIDQLEYEGYSTEEATFGADNAGADWNAECAEKAKSYLEYASFSRQGLYDQLAYEGFTDAEIQFGLAAVGY